MINKPTKIIVFDWGNTLMVDYVDQNGRMADWSKVTAVDGAKEMLSKIHGSYQIVVATNATDSSSADVMKALQRVGLDSYIDLVYTFNELKARKPDPHFFTSLTDILASYPQELIMIGDNYLNDILPAWQSGWHSIWFNPHNILAAGHLPVQESECKSLSEIPDLLISNKLPTVQKAISWYMQQGATYSLMAHVNAVAAIAYQMAVWLKKKGFQISPLLTHRGGLLHDISKLRETKNSNHAMEAYKFLLDKQQPELARIAACHLIGDLKSEDYRPTTWEEKIVNYADKLTEGNQIVLLTERLMALQERYPQFAEKIHENTPLVQSLESEIVTELETTPQNLLLDLKKALFNGHN